MPQMAPISWLILFIVFSISFVIFNILNYYCFNKKFLNNSVDASSKNKSSNHNLNWKW